MKSLRSQHSRVPALLSFVDIMISGCGGTETKSFDIHPSSNEKATLVLHREPRFGCSAVKFDVLVNENKAETIANAQTLTLTFQPRAGKQTLQVVNPGAPHPLGLAPRFESKTLYFEAQAGNVYHFTCYYEAVTGASVGEALNSHDSIGLTQQQ
jgi:hypothetical protein